MEGDGGSDGCQSEKIIAPGRDAAIRVTLSLPLSVEQPKRHIWMVVNNLAGDQGVVLKREELWQQSKSGQTKIKVEGWSLTGRKRSSLCHRGAEKTTIWLCVCMWGGI